MILQNIRKIVLKNSPVLLTAVSVVGLLSTAILAVKATPQAVRLLEERGRELLEIKNPIAKSVEVVKLTWQGYIPAATVGLITVTCIIASHRVSVRRSAALASVYALTETAFKEYQWKVEETIGSIKERKIVDAVVKDRLVRDPVGTNEIIMVGNDADVLCYDSLSGRYFKSDIEKINRSILDANQRLLSSTFITLNELYYDLGLSGIDLGELMGWDINKGWIEANFSSQLTDGTKPCLVLNFVVQPQYNQ